MNKLPIGQQKNSLDFSQPVTPSALSEISKALMQQKVDNGRSLQLDLESRTKVLNIHERQFLLVEELVNLKTEVANLSQLVGELQCQIQTLQNNKKQDPLIVLRH
jgi:hypothetical protein